MIAASPFSIHPNRSTEVKVRIIIDGFRKVSVHDKFHIALVISGFFFS
jgi:hypothetical protein